MRTAVHMRLPGPLMAECILERGPSARSLHLAKRGLEGGHAGPHILTRTPDDVPAPKAAPGAKPTETVESDIR